MITLASRDTHLAQPLRRTPALAREFSLPFLAAHRMVAAFIAQDFGALGRAEVTVACIALRDWCAGCWTVHLVLPSPLVEPYKRLGWRFWIYLYTQISHCIPFMIRGKNTGVSVK
jgi:hypothetical protein